MSAVIPILDKKNRTSDVYCDGQKVLFEPLFGYRQYVPLPDSKRKIFDIASLTSCDLGQNIREVLANSRVLDISEVDDFFDDERLVKDDAECLNIMIEIFEKKSKAALYSNLMKCPLHLENEIVSFRPTKHDRSDRYSGLSLDDKELIYLPLDSSDEDLGDALKLAFKRCIGVGAFEFHKRLKKIGWE